MQNRTLKTQIPWRCKSLLLTLAVFTTLSCFTTGNIFAQGTAFTYQGRLNAGTNPATGLYDLQFYLYNAATSGSIIGGPETNAATPVTNGLFTVVVDFGTSVFTGGTNWLSVGVRTNGGTAFSTLAPRQQLTPTPYSIFAENANAAGISGSIPAADLSGVSGSGLIGLNASQLTSGTVPVSALGNAWTTGGNGGTSPSINYLGTPDLEALNFRVNNIRGLSIQPDPVFGIPNIIGGSFANFIAPPSVGCVIAGGGYGSGGTNFIIGGGNLNVISGGYANSITNGYDGVIGGGEYNTIGASAATVPGGYLNIANGSYSFAAGQEAQALHTGSFVWSDASGGAFSSQGANEFLIRAAGGVGIGVTGPPQQLLSVQGGVNLDQYNGNQGYLNNGLGTGFGLSFGGNSGEGIASQRQAGGGGANLYGLDFYTGGTRRMSILNSGFVGIGTQTPVNPSDTLFQVTSPTTNAYAGMWIETGSGGEPFYGYSEGGAYSAYTWVDGTDANKWKLWNGGGIWLTVTTGGNVGIGTTTPSSALEVANGDARLDGNRVLLYSGSDTNNGLGSGQLVPGAGIFSGSGPCLFGYDGGCLGAISPNVICLSWDFSGDVWVSNNLSTATLTIRGGADLAEPFNISAGQQEVSEGAVVVIDEQNPGHLKLSDSAYDVRVAGVVSGANGINPGIQMHQQGILEGGKNVALTGRVYVQADASNGAIHPGDMLTTSSIPGHAMKVSDHARAAGAILGKAMTALSEGKGMVLVLVTLQ